MRSARNASRACVASKPESPVEIVKFGATLVARDDTPEAESCTPARENMRMRIAK